jgi:hypothetical protein
MSAKSGDPSEPVARAVVAQALRLSESERVRVAAALLESLNGAPDTASDEEWLAEINRRADRSVRRDSQGEAWTTVRDELLAELRKCPELSGSSPRPRAELRQAVLWCEESAGGLAQCS